MRFFVDDGSGTVLDWVTCAECRRDASEARSGLCQDDDGRWYCEQHWNVLSIRARLK